MGQGDMGKELSLSDGSSLPTLRINWQAVVLLLIALALVVTRLWALDNRSYSHDESIHAWEAWKLVTGQRYVHDPVYHGPFLYHVTALVYFLFGVSDTTARLGAALFAIAAVLLVWPMRRWLGRVGAVFAMFLLTISPTMMYRGRFIRHDIFVIVPTMVMVFCFFRYLEDRQERWLYIIAGALSLMFCAKANAFINGAIFGSFWLIYLLVQWASSRRSLQELPSFDLVMLLGTLVLPLASPVVVRALGFDPLDYSQTGLVRTLIVVLMMVSLSAGIGTWWKTRVWLISAGIYYSIYILLYTTLFTNAQGFATGLVGMLGYWLSQQGVARGSQPWYYYFFLLTVYEILLLVLAGLGVLYYAVAQTRSRQAPETPADAVVPDHAPRSTFVHFLLYWVLLNLIIFTWTGEKMPWQMLHIVLPLGLLGGWFLGQVWDNTPWRELLARNLAQVALLLPVCLFSLLLLLAAMLGPVRPFSGFALDQLRVTIHWLLSLMLLLIAAVSVYRVGRGLGLDGWGRVLLAAVFLVLSAITLRSGLRLSFVNQNYATEFLMYAAATPDTGLVMRELEEMSRHLAGDRELKVAYDDESSWPFVWYLRDYRNKSFFAGSSSPAADAQVVLVGPGNESKIRSQLSGKYLRRDYRLIWWPNQDVYAGMTPAKLWKDLRDPERRSYWWDIFWHRKYPQSTTAWPYVHRFTMYVRKDAAAQLWDYGPEVAGAGIELPQDEYEERRVQVTAIASWGSYGSGPGQFNYPKDLALDGDGNVYVVDSYNHRVQVFDASGGFVREWGSQGTAPGQFQEPWGIAVGGEGKVYVADTWNHRIQRFDREGRFEVQWGMFGDTAGALGDGFWLYGPRDVEVDGEGNVLVSDTGNKRVLRYSAEGELLGQVGGAGSLEGQYREPVGLGVDGAGNVYVADTWNQRVQKLDSELRYVGQWPVLGWEGEGVTNKPYLAVGSGGAVYVTAPDYHWVVKYDGEGEVQAVWGQYGTDLSSFNMPSGIAVDAAENVYVLDSANHRLLKFAPIE
jgi:uncharacterized protein (TIGR03663 family)